MRFNKNLSVTVRPPKVIQLRLMGWALALFATSTIAQQPLEFAGYLQINVVNPEQVFKSIQLFRNGVPTNFSQDGFFQKCDRLVFTEQPNGPKEVKIYLVHGGRSQILNARLPELQAPCRNTLTVVDRVMRVIMGVTAESGVAYAASRGTQDAQLQIPVLQANEHRLVEGSRAIVVPFFGGRAPYTGQLYRISEDGTRRTMASTQSESQREILFPKVKLTPGTYGLQVCEAPATTVAGSSVTTDAQLLCQEDNSIKVVARKLALKFHGSDVKLTFLNQQDILLVQLLQLESTSDGGWALEAVQQAWQFRQVHSQIKLWFGKYGEATDE